MKNALYGGLAFGLLTIAFLSFGQSAQPQKSEFLYFGATWCGPCNKMKSTTLEDPEVKKELAKYQVKMYDIDQSPDIARQYNVTVVPTYLVVSKTVVVNRTTGYKPPTEFLDWLRQ